MIREETGDRRGRLNGTGSMTIKNLSRGEAGYSFASPETILSTFDRQHGRDCVTKRECFAHRSIGKQEHRFEQIGP